MGEGTSDRGYAASARVATLLAGDQFVRNSLLRDALAAEVADQLALHEIEFGWPHDPFGPVAEVKEAAGTEERMLAALDGIEVVVTEMAPMTRRVLDGAPALRLIVVCRGGPVNVNLEAATERGIPVCYSPARNAAATAEYTIGLLLAALRHIVEGAHDLVARRLARRFLRLRPGGERSRREDGWAGRLRRRRQPGRPRTARLRRRGAGGRSLRRSRDGGGGRRDPRHH